MSRPLFGAIGLRRAPILLIDWVDSSATPGWTKLRQINPIAQTCRSVGWLHSEDARYITLVAHHAGGGTPDDVDDADNDQGDAIMTIPKVAIVRRRRLRQ